MPYIPPNTQSLKDNNISAQSRIALMGYPFTGKTWSALTWPNPIVCNFDNKFGAHLGRDILIVPFHDPAFVDSLAKRQVPAHPPNVRDAFKVWLDNQAPKLERDQTLIIDSWTMLNTAQELQTSKEVFLTSQGKVDDRAPWRVKLDYFKDICNRLRTLTCDVIVTFHEQDDRFKTGTQAGEVNGKVRPLMSGQFKDQLMGHFTDFFRQHCIDKAPKWEDQSIRNQKGKDWIKDLWESTPANIPTIYAWQTYSDDIADCGSTLNNPPPFIPVNYSSFKQYKI